MKKITALILTILILISIIPEIAPASDLTYETVGDTLYISGTGELIYKTGGEKNVVIGEGITAIGDHVFDNNQTIENVTLPESMVSLGKWAFYLCKNLKTINMPDGITSIGQACFCGCEKLTSFHIPASLTHIPYDMLSFCSSLTELYIPDTVASISDAPFRSINVENLNIPNSITRLPNQYFYMNQAIKEIYIPGNIKEIGNMITYGCNNLESVVIASGTEIIGREAFSSLQSKIKTIDLPSTVKKIGDDFTNSNVVVNYHGTIEQYNAIDLGNNELNVNILGNDGEILAQNNLCAGIIYKLNKDGILEITGSGDITDFSLVNLPKSQALEATAVTISEGITSIGNYCFYKMPKIQSVTLPSTVKSIGKYAFYECASLTSINLTDVATISDFCFYGCKSLTALDTNAYMGARADEFTGSEQMAYNMSLIRTQAIIDYLNEFYLTNDSLAFDIDYATTKDKEILKKAALTITKGCNTDKQKVRALYDWIHNSSNNIAYDFYTSNFSAIDVLRNQEGICSGQAQLLSALMKSLGIRSTIVRGIRRETQAYSLNYMYKNGNNITNVIITHEWVMAYVDNQWCMYDVLHNKYMITDVSDMAKHSMPEHLDGLLVWAPGAYDETRGPGLSTHLYYINGEYIGYDKGVKTKTGSNSLSVGGCLRYATKYYQGGINDDHTYDGYAYKGEYSIGGAYYRDNGLMVEGQVFNIEDKKVLFKESSSFVINDEIDDLGLLNNKLAMYIGQSITLPDYYLDKDILLTSDNSSYISVDGLTITALKEGYAKLRLDGSKWLDICIYGNVAKSQNFFKSLCDHEHSHEYLSNTYCDYCGQLLTDNFVEFSSGNGLSVRPNGLWEGKLYYSTDTNNWYECASNTTYYGNKEEDGTEHLYFRGENNTVITGDTNHSWLVAGNKPTISGNILNLLNYKDIKNVTIGDYCFAGMFNKNYYRDIYADNLIISDEDTEVSKYYAYKMFENCHQLIKPGIIKSVNLSENCYSSMYLNCDNLRIGGSLNMDNNRSLALASKTDSEISGYMDNMFRGVFAMDDTLESDGTPKPGYNYYLEKSVRLGEVTDGIIKIENEYIINGSWLNVSYSSLFDDYELKRLYYKVEDSNEEIHFPDISQSSKKSRIQTSSAGKYITVYGEFVSKTKEKPSTEIKYSGSDKVTKINAEYTVNTDNVKDIKVYYNYDNSGSDSKFSSSYENGKLTISTSLSSGINLTKPICNVTAILNDGTETAPDLTLDSLLFNDQKVTDSIDVTSQDITRSGDNITASISVHSDILNNSYIFAASAYKANGQLITCSYKNIKLDEQDKTISFDLNNCAMADKVKIFIMDNNQKPLIAEIELNDQ